MPTRRGHLTSFEQGRICAVSACDTVLSRYNDSTLCWAHDDNRVKR